jgi:hypothetical protein
VSALLAWRPFLDPIDAHRVWWALLVPLALLVSIAYKAVRLHSMRRYWVEVASMTGQIVVWMVLLGAATYVLIGWVVPAIAPR